MGLWNYISQKAKGLGVTEKAPRRAALPQRDGADSRGEWLAARGPRAVPPAAGRRVKETAGQGAKTMSITASGPDCCGGLGNINYRKVARWEQRTRKLSSAFGSPYLACYFLGGVILLLNVLRSHCFTQAMLSQPKMEGLDNPTTYGLGLALLGVGTVFVLSSFFALGFTGTFLGDYFGILKEARVTTFPFSVMDNPMYWGSTANYLGWGLINPALQEPWNQRHASPTGLLLTVVVALVYVVAILYEEPFTTEIYRQKAAKSHGRR
ncbi:phosphatidylethanolamine N-methyltransferase isoform X3 [Heterocephalus glaber]|uniref:Phosphatidylethanolamine N-methyltransferase n=1 Tax=Heterocephalus glaber TaxID=10181 RepID=A0AAX6QA08_HETGA|nr:phosphatidylethanolamine N-methyltransferase isoform X3 [Heterocephalus glaber]